MDYYLHSLGEDDLYKFDEVPLKLDIIKNDKYVIGFHKIDEYKLRFFIYGSNGSFERVFDKRNSSSELRTAIVWHRPYFGVISGIVQVHDSVMLSDYHIDSDVLITGDSFIEGTSLFAYGGELEDRWCYLLAERVGLSRTVISGHGGESINGRVINRLKKEISWFPNIKYVIVSLGTNNEDSSYISYMGDLIDYLESINVTPIIVTITPKGGDQRVKNNWIKNRGVPYIDMHKATASQSDGAVWKSGYVMSDGVHPTPIGHKKMDEQIIIDCPFLG